MAEKLIWRGPGVLRRNGVKPKEVYYPDEEIPEGKLQAAEIAKLKKKGKIKGKTSTDEANERRKKTAKANEAALAGKGKK
jgi:hypothetical protein